jgi:hypothetical protein
VGEEVTVLASRGGDQPAARVGRIGGRLGNMLRHNFYAEDELDEDSA